MISNKVYELCRSPESVSSELARNPTEAPEKIAKQLYSSSGDFSTGKGFETPAEYSAEGLKRTLECGNWGPKQPSELFLKVFLATHMT